MNLIGNALNQPPEPNDPSVETLFVLPLAMTCELLLA